MKNVALTNRPASFDVNAMRRQFPVLARTVHGKPLAYLDNGASAQRPLAVIEIDRLAAGVQRALKIFA
jgi:selenocysteine lyase/cysteine desulfurase